MIRLAAILVWILALYAMGHGQSEAIKVDEFGKVSCEDFLARADNFFIALNNNPTAQGYFVINGDSHHRATALKYTNLLNAAVAGRRYDRSRVEIVHVPTSEGVGASFWMLPPAASIPAAWSSEWDFTLPPKTKAFMWNAGFSEMCGSPVNVPLLSRYLEANPGSHVHVVIYAPTKKSRLEGRREAKDALQRIDPNRVRYFYSKMAGYVIQIEEYWFVPKKR
jgi:hypothetical protein